MILFTNLCNSLLNRRFGNKAIDHHFPVLADTVGSAECLQSTDKTNTALFSLILSETKIPRWLVTHLDIIVGVPVRIIDDDSVSRRKVDAQTTRSGGEEESKLRSTWSCEQQRKQTKGENVVRPLWSCFQINTNYCVTLTIKAVDSLLPHISSDSTINSFIFVTLILEKVFQQVQHFCHLRENKNPVAALFQLSHHLLQQHQFP